MIKSTPVTRERMAQVVEALREAHLKSCQEFRDSHPFARDWTEHQIVQYRLSNPWENLHGSAKTAGQNQIAQAESRLFLGETRNASTSLKGKSHEALTLCKSPRSVRRTKHAARFRTAGRPRRMYTRIRLHT